MNETMRQPQRQQSAPAPAPSVPTDADFERLLQRDAKTTVEYVPYGAKDNIKLTATNVQNLIAVRTKKGHTCSTRDAVKFIAMCQAKRLNPFEGDCFLIGYDTQDGPQFALVTAHQTYLKRAELHAEFDGMKSGLIVKAEDGKLIEIEGDFYDDGQTVVGGWAMVYFKNRKQPMYKRLRLARFNKGFGVWRDDAAGMICKCAEADALRSSFPTMLGGLYMREETQEPTSVPLSKPDFSKPSNTPLFGGKGGELPPDAQPEPEREPEPEPEPEAEPEPQDTGNGKPNYLKGVRNLCNIARVTEGELLGFLSQAGRTDGSAASLEDLALTDGEALRLVYDNWSGEKGISTQIIAARKGAAK